MSDVVSPTAARRFSVAVTGSKGGVGKSNLAVNLALSLGRIGRRVLVVDGDIGLASLDVLLGLVTERTVEHLIHGEASLEELLVDGPGGIRILPASSGVPQLTRLDTAARNRLLAALAHGARLADNVIIDTGAGLGETTLALQLAASRVIVVTTTEPTSMVDAYASIKVLWDADPHKRIDVVVNNVESSDEARTAYESIAKACGHFLHDTPRWLGYVEHDPELPDAVKRQRALIDLNPSSPAARCYQRLALQMALEPTAGEAGNFWYRLVREARQEMVH